MGASTTTAPPAPAAAPQAPGAPAAPQSPAARDAFQRLASSVSSGLPQSDARMLAEQSTRHGVIGEAQAIIAARRAAALPAADRARFQGAVEGAGSDTERAFIYKALAAGHPVPEVVEFAKQIHGWDDRQLIRTLNLSAHTAPQDQVQEGLAQQFEDACVPTTAQVLRGEVDPIYSLEVRTRNQDPHFNGAWAGQDPNPTLRAEQEQLLEEVGDGRAVPMRTEGGEGTRRSRIDDVLNSVTRQTGLVFDSVMLLPEELNPESRSQMVDKVVDQLRQGIPTPFELRTPDDTAGHYALALAVEGEGAEQRFLVHDPYTGNTGYVSRAELEWGSDVFPNWENLRIAGYARAQPPRTDEAR